MNPADFASMVRQVFGFLVARSFVDSWKGGYRVRFDSPTVFVSVMYDATRSYELGIEIGLKAGISHPVERPFTISEMLRAVGQSDLGEAATLVQARPNEVRERLVWLSGLLCEYGVALLDGDRAWFEALDRQRDADCNAYAMQTNLARATREALKAWQQGNYNEVVQKLEPVEKNLPTSEQKRLEIARKRSKAR